MSLSKKTISDGLVIMAKISVTIKNDEVASYRNCIIMAKLLLS